AETLGDRGSHCLGALLAADVGLQKQRLGACGLYLLLRAPANLLVDLRHDDRRAFTRKAVGIGATDALPRPRDDGHFVLQTHARPPDPSSQTIEKRGGTQNISSSKLQAASFKPDLVLALSLWLS